MQTQKNNSSPYGKPRVYPTQTPPPPRPIWKCIKMQYEKVGAISKKCDGIALIYHTCK